MSSVFTEAVTGCRVLKTGPSMLRIRVQTRKLINEPVKLLQYCLFP